MAVESSKKSPPLPWPALIPLGHHAGKPAISLAKTVMLVGSRSNAHLHLMSRHVSKAHALILSWQGQVYIRDLASREKVYINGREVREAWLKDRDLIKIGSFTFKYKDGPKKGAMNDQAMEPADLEVDGADAPLSVAEKVMLIGRRQTCDVSLMEASVSTAHAVLFHVGGKRYVRDLGSRSGTFVNGTKVHQHELTPGDTIRIGETDLRYVLAGDDSHSIRPATEEEAFAFTAVTADEPEIDFTSETTPDAVEGNWGEPEMIPVHSEDESRVSVTPPPRGASREELDELEDLVGTAPLDVGAEIAREQRTTTPGHAQAAPEAAELSDPDLIPMDWDETPVPAPVAPPAAPRPIPMPAKPPLAKMPPGKVPGAVAVAAGSAAAAAFLKSSAPAAPIASPAPIAPPAMIAPPAPPALIAPAAPIASTPAFEDQAISFENDPLNVEIESHARASDPTSAHTVEDIDAELDLLGLDFEPEALVAAVSEPAEPAPAPAMANVTPAPVAGGEDLIALDAFDEAEVHEVASSEGTRAAGFELDAEHETPAVGGTVPEAPAVAEDEAWPVVAEEALSPELAEAGIAAVNDLPVVGETDTAWATAGEEPAAPGEVGAVQELDATWSDSLLPAEGESTISGVPAAEETGTPEAAEATGTIENGAIEAEGALEPEILEEVWTEEELLEDVAPVAMTPSDSSAVEGAAAGIAVDESAIGDAAEMGLVGAGAAALDHAVEEVAIEEAAIEETAIGEMPLDLSEADWDESGIIGDVSVPETIDEVRVEETSSEEIACSVSVPGSETPEVTEAPEAPAEASEPQVDAAASVIAPGGAAFEGMGSEVDAPEAVLVLAESEVEPSPELLAQMEAWEAADAVSAIEASAIAAAPLVPVIAESPSIEEQTPEAFDEMFEGSREGEETLTAPPVEADAGEHLPATTPTVATDANASGGDAPPTIDQPTELAAEATQADQDDLEPIEEVEIQEWDLSELAELEPLETMETVEEAGTASESAPFAAVDLGTDTVATARVEATPPVESRETPGVDAGQTGAAEEVAAETFHDLADELPDSLEATPESDPDLSLAEGFSAEPDEADLALIDTITAQEAMAVERPPNLTGAEDLPLDLEALDEVLQLDEEEVPEASVAVASANLAQASTPSAGLIGSSDLGAVAPSDIGEPVDPEQSSITGVRATDAGEPATLEAESEEAIEDLPPAEDFLPLLDLDAGDLAPANSGRNPDALLPLEQVDPDDLDEVLEVEEIVEPTEPTAESALDLEGELEEVTLEEELPEVQEVDTSSPESGAGGAEQSWDAEWTASQSATSQAGLDSLSDTAFGQQVAEFTTGASNGEIVEAATSGSTANSAAPHAELAAAPEAAAIEEFADLDDAEQNLAEAMSADGQAVAAEDYASIDTTPGGIEPLMPSAVLPEDFAPETVSDDEAATGAIIAVGANPSPAELDEAPVDEATVDGASGDQDGSSAGFGGFTIGTDLASYIGGMPLVLPDLPPAPQFAQAQMGFETTRGPFGEARPRTIQGAALADEVMQAAEGLRDVELMDDEDVQDAPQQGGAIADDLDEEEAALFSGEGAVSDEWNLGAVLDEDETPEAPLTPESLTEESVAELEAASQGDLSESNQSVTETVDGFVGLTHAPSDGPVEMEALSLTSGGPVDAVIESEYAEPEQLEALADLVEEPVGGIPAASVAMDQGESLEADAPAETMSEAIAPVAWHETEEASAAGLEAEAAELEDQAIREAGLVGETILFREVQAEAAALASLHAPAAIEEEEPAMPDFAEMPEEGDFAEDRALDLATPPAVVEESPVTDEGATADEGSAVDDAWMGDEAPVVHEAPMEDESPVADDSGGGAFGSMDGAEGDAFGGATVDEVPPPSAPSTDTPASPRGLSMSDLGMGAALGIAVGGKGARGASRAAGAMSAEGRRAGQGAAPANDVFSGGVAGSAAPFGGLDDVQQMDVFAQTALGPADSVFGEDVAPAAKPARRKAISPADSGAETARRARGQRAIVPPRLGVLGSGQMATEVEVATPAFGGGFNEPAVRPVYRAPQHHRRSVGRVLAMVALLLLLIGAAIIGVWYFVKPQFTFEGALRFNNLTALTQHQRAEFIRSQRELLSSRVVRQNAGYYMANQSLPAGFIERPEDFGRVKAEFPDDRADALVVTYKGNDAKDLERVAALLQAVYIENASAKDKVLRLDGEIEKFRKQIAEVKELQAKYAALKKEVDSAPTAEDVRKLEDLKQDAEIQYDIAASAAKDAKNEVLKLEAQMTPATGGAAADGGATPQDVELVKIQKELEAAALGLANAKASASEDADAKQKALDLAVEAFQQAAANVARENPELAQYVAAVQQLQERTHKLGGDLIARQQSTQQRLERFAKALNDSIAAERIKAWAADAELNAAQIQLDFAQRKLNAVNDPQSNLPPDSPDVKAAQNGVTDLNKKIETRKAWIEKTMALNQAALQLAELIKENKEQLDSDRKRIESDIKEQEQAFARSALVEKLPEAQRAAATALKAKQDQITALRTEYAAALARRTAESNLAVREIEGRIAKLSAQADERKRLLAAQGAQTMNQEQLVALQKKQAALKAAEEQAAAARKVYLDRNKAVTAAVGSREAVETKRTEMEGYDPDSKTRHEELKQIELNLAASEEEKRRIVTAVEPRKGDVREIEKRDDRLLYSFGASAGVAVIFCVVVLLAGTGRPAVQLEPLHRTEEDERAEMGPAEAGPLAIDEIGAPATERARRVNKAMR